MNSYLIIPVAETAFCMALLVLLGLFGQRHIARKPFTIFLGFMAFWGIFIFLMRQTASLQMALVWEWLVFVSILGASLTFYYFARSLTGKHLSKKVTYLTYAFYAAIVALLPTDLIVKEMQMLWYGKAPVIGPLFPLYVLCVYVPLVLALITFIKHRNRCRIIEERVRDQYIIAGIIIMFIGGTTDYLPPLGVSIYPLGIVGNIIFCALATVAMMRHGLLEIKMVLRKGVAYSLISMVLFGLFGAVIFFVSNVFNGLTSPGTVFITAIAAFVVAALFQPIFIRLQRVTDRWFFRERYDHIQGLQRLANESEGNLNLQQFADSLVRAVGNAMTSQQVYLLLPDKSTDSFISYAHCGGRNGRKISFARSSPLVVTLQYHDGLLDMNDLDMIPSLGALSEHDRHLLIEQKHIEIIVPLKHQEQLDGILLLGGKLRGEPYSFEDRQMLQEVAGAVALRIDNAGRYESMKRAHGELRKAIDGIIYAISLVVESRDPYTAGHQRRVAELARAIARKMGLAEWDITGIYIAGLLHDVGKVAVPSEILSKPGKISQYEFSIIKNHPQVGNEILARIDFPWPITQAIIQHHERMDGSGYPNGLFGDEIIQEARILAVADVVEAMSSHRPYRPALGLSTALMEIMAQNGKLYDEDVVTACTELLSEKQAVFDELMDVAASPHDITRKAAVV
ncbi:HD domain-containing phosphohydrolase [Chloroflexota bacterium]